MFSPFVERVISFGVVRALPAPPGVAVVAVGGATLGGSGKTPLAIACAAELAAAGVRAVVVGHAYRASPGRSRVVRPDDPLDEVGDEALVAARALEAIGGRVVVGPSRRDAIALGARTGDVLVLDGVAQLAPVRADLSLLAVDAAEPWGSSRAFPPGGGLRAPVAALVAACDAIVPIGQKSIEVGAFGFRSLGSMASWAPAGPAQPSMWPASVESRGACADGGDMLTWETLRTLRIGLVAALARPHRVIRWLRQHGVSPRAMVCARDHGPFGRGARRRAAAAHEAHHIDVWLATAKCALHARRALPWLPLAVLEHSLVLDPALRSRLRGLCSGAARVPGSFAIPPP